MATASNAISISGTSFYQTLATGFSNVFVPMFTMDPTTDIDSFCEFYFFGYSTTNPTNVAITLRTEYYNHNTATWDQGDNLWAFTGTGFNTAGTISRESINTANASSFNAFYSSSANGTVKLFPGMRIGYIYNSYTPGPMHLHYRAVKFVNG